MIIFYRGLEWTFLTVLFGLAQLWIDISMRLFRGKPITAFSVMEDGAILFFVMGVTVGITIDYHLDMEKAKVPNFLKRLMFLVLPAIVGSFVIFAYMLSRGGLDEGQENLFVVLNLCAMAGCIVYATGAKTYLFYRPVK